MTRLTTYEGSTCIINTVAGLHSATVLFMHGLGDTCDGWRQQAEEWAQQLPHTKFILPSAPVQRVTWNGGAAMPSWYDIVGLTERESEECHGIETSRARITELVQKEINEFKIAPSRIVVGGFSQGGALSIWTGLQWSGEKLGGVVCLSGYLPAASKFKMTEQGKLTPVFHGHGSRDPLIKTRVAEKTKKAISDQMQSGVKYEYRIYPHMAHSTCQDEMDDLITFFKSVIPPVTAVSNKLPKEMSVKELKVALRAIGLNDASFIEKSEMIAALENHEL